MSLYLGNLPIRNGGGKIPSPAFPVTTLTKFQSSSPERYVAEVLGKRGANVSSSVFVEQLP